MGPIQIRGADLADRRWAAVMARWERAHGTDWAERSATGLYSGGDAAERDLEEILGQIQGVGTVRVLLTVDTDGERQLAQNTELSVQRQRDGTGGLFPDARRPVLLDGGDREETVVTRTAYPTYRGALVVCQGGRPGRREAGSHRGGVRLDRTVQRPRHRGKVSVIIWRRNKAMSGNAKRNLVVGTMAVLVCAAVGLNWKYSTQEAAPAGRGDRNENSGRGHAGLRSGGGRSWRRTTRLRGGRLLCLRPADPAAGAGQRHFPPGGRCQAGGRGHRRWPIRRRRVFRCWRPTR